jgi:ATP-dependent DNA ligase
MAFIPPMLCSALRDPSLLANLSYIAEPKLDGQRIQVQPPWPRRRILTRWHLTPPWSGVPPVKHTRRTNLAYGRADA